MLRIRSNDTVELLFSFTEVAFVVGEVESSVSLVTADRVQYTTRRLLAWTFDLD
jgi:hypothetical protein